MLVEDPGASGTPQIRGILVEFRGPDDAGRMHPLSDGRNVLGRDGDCNVVIDDPLVSKMHAFIYLDGSGARLVDNSQNGTIIDGRRVLGAQVPLAPGSKLDLGGVRMVFVLVPNPYGP